jgi:hypothetical protein
VKNRAFNRRILDIWITHFKGQSVLAPLFFHDFKENVGILFVGSNPSFNEKWINKLLMEKCGAKGKMARKFFTWKIDKSSNIDFPRELGSISISSLSQYVDKIIELEDESSGEYPYFKKFHDIAKESNLEFEHIDLFFVRETAQKKLEELVWPKKKLDEFGEDQIRVSLEVIKKIMPKVMVVANAFASRIVRKELETQLAWNEELGHHVVSFKNERIPVFFTSMLTGQRALDDGSFERLKWAIRRWTKTKG